MALADNVRMFPGISPNDYDANLMLEAAARRNLKSVIILGYGEDGELFFSSSLAAGPKCLWMLEKIKARLLDIGED